MKKLHTDVGDLSHYFTLTSTFSGQIVQASPLNVNSKLLTNLDLNTKVFRCTKEDALHENYH
jgi:hypothetical protein